MSTAISSGIVSRSATATPLDTPSRISVTERSTIRAVATATARSSGATSGAPLYYPDSRSYPSYPRDSRDVYRGYAGPAFQYGVDDGYQKGVEDARKNRSFDPLRHEWYRDGDRHYNSRDGSRQEYKDVYRQGFQQGYDRGFREGRYR